MADLAKFVSKHTGNLPELQFKALEGGHFTIVPPGTDYANGIVVPPNTLIIPDTGSAEWAWVTFKPKTVRTAPWSGPLPPMEDPDEVGGIKMRVQVRGYGLCEAVATSDSFCRPLENICQFVNSSPEGAKDQVPVYRIGAPSSYIPKKRPIQFTSRL